MFRKIFLKKCSLCCHFSDEERLGRTMWRIAGQAKRMWRTAWIHVMGVMVMLILLGVAPGSISRATTHAASGDWPTYLENLSRDGFKRAETTINRTTAPNLKMH